MQLHEACRERLVECMTKGLQEATFKNRNFLDYSSLCLLDSCSSILPRNVQDLIGTWISLDHPLRDFSYGFIYENWSSYVEKLKNHANEDFPVRLSRIADVEQLAVEIIESFVTLPWKYKVVLPFIHTGDSDLLIPNRLPLSDDLTIKKSSELQVPFPRALSPLATIMEVNTDWRADRLYLEATLTGYIGVGVDTETVRSFYHQVRAIAGIGLAVNAFRLNFSRYLALPALGSNTSVDKLYIFRERADEESGSARYIPDIIGPLEQLELDPKNASKMILLPIAFDEGQECGRLREAGQWHFASTTERREIFAFVEAVVVLEILFNDRATASAVGVDKLIANRCAYLIASSTAERQRIIEALEKIYEARSQIVHRGKARLNKAERDLLIQARALGSCSIMKELGMIFGSKQNNTPERGTIA